MRRVLVISDLHCGHAVGLTPPEWQTDSRFAEMQDIYWSFYRDEIKKLGKIDTVLALGDCLDGAGDRSGSSELTVRDQVAQANMAADCINHIKAENVVIVRGTPYHVSSEKGTDFEDLVAERTGATIGGHEWVEIDGVVFDIKHKVGSSTIPHGRHTAVAKENLWNILWSERGTNPRANVIIRGHVHYYSYCGGTDWLGMTMPALQGLGSKYGVTQCSGIVDFGFVHFDVEDGRYSWEPHILEIKGYQESIKL